MDHETVNGTDSGVYTTNGEDKPKAPVMKYPENLEEFLKNEIEANKLSYKRTMMFGSTAVVCLAIYLTWLHTSVRANFFNPPVVAAFLAGTIEDHLPGVLGRTEAEMMRGAPKTVSDLSDKIISEVPKARKMAEQQIENVYQQLPLLREMLNVAIHTYFEEHRAELKEFAAAHNDQEFVRHFTTHVLAEMQKEMRHHFVASTAFDLAKIRAQTLEQLTLLNERLKVLAEKSPYHMTRQELVARRLVAVWGAMFHDSAKGFEGPVE